MRKRKIFATTLLLLMLLSAAAESYVTGRIDGHTLYVSWQAPEGHCELTVSQNDWPIGVYNVSGGEGSCSVPLGDVTGTFKLRLRSESGCWTAKVNGEKPATPVPTEAPTAEPTEAPTPAPTEAPTAEPTEVPTKEPDRAMTPVPTEAPTAVPTVVPTKAPTAKPTAAPQPVTNRDDLARQVVTLVNEERAKQGLSALRMDSELTRAACVRAGELTTSFSHTRPDGSKWSTVSRAAYAENIARGQRTADKVMAAWMSSTTGHRENILHASYGSIGVCAYSYNGVMYWVQLFGK